MTEDLITLKSLTVLFLTLMVSLIFLIASGFFFTEFDEEEHNSADS